MGASFFGSHLWLFDVFANFRIQYLVVAPLVIATLFLVKRPQPATTLSILCLINLWFTIPYLITEPSADKNSKAELSVALINVNTQLGSPERVAAYINEADPDLVVLLEINHKWISELSGIIERYPHFKTKPQHDNFGIGLFSKYPLSRSEVKFIGDAGLPSISATVEFETVEIDVIATHPLPPKDKAYAILRDDQLEALASYVLKKQNPIILLGDLNATCFSHHFQKFIKQSQLIDSSKAFGIQPTWPSFLPMMGIQIDHILHSESITVVERDTGSKVGSDHLPLFAALRW